MDRPELKEIQKELDKVFGKDYSKKHPDAVLKMYHSQSIQSAADRIGESVDSLSMKMELSSIRNPGAGLGGLGAGLGGMGGGMGMPGGMNYMDNMLGDDKFTDMDLTDDFDLGDDELEEKPKKKSKSSKKKK